MTLRHEIILGFALAAVATLIAICSYAAPNSGVVSLTAGTGSAFAPDMILASGPSALPNHLTHDSPKWWQR